MALSWHIENPEQTGPLPSLHTLDAALASCFCVSLSLAVSTLPFNLKLLPPASFHPDAPEKKNEDKMKIF